MNRSDREITPDGSTKSVSITQQVYEALRDKILIGQMEPGARLKVESLKSMLDSGASPIREALSLLTSDQLVERLDQRGFRVAEVSGAQFDEILRLRCALEEMALRESIARADNAWEDRLVLAHHRMVRTPRENTSAFEEQHKSFHQELISACNSPILVKFCDQLYDLNIRYRFLAGKTKSYPSRDVSKEHADILAAAVDRDADAATEALLTHYRKTGQFLADQFEDHGIAPA
ncbi:MAG: GntR family transcriptional regulator [Rhodobacteraceae bacterium]|nr:GntR family transcriptional regulator [Paracoccaceae bacterium]